MSGRGWFVITNGQSRAHYAGLRDGECADAHWPGTDAARRWDAATDAGNVPQCERCRDAIRRECGNDIDSEDNSQEQREPDAD